MSSDVTTLRKAIEQTPGVVEIVRIEAYADADWGRYGMESWARYDLPYVGPLEDAPEGLLDQEYDAGYGSPDRPMWTAWSATHVGFGVEYDGATGSGAVPRNPDEVFQKVNDYDHAEAVAARLVEVIVRLDAETRARQATRGGADRIIARAGGAW